MTNTNEVLKPCPFCGGAPEPRHGTFGFYRVQCDACGSSTENYDTKEDAIAAWNRRNEMTNTNETITDIIRKIRAEADYIEEIARDSLEAGKDLNGMPFTESAFESALYLANRKREEADRLEAALKREKAEIEAGALEVGGMVEASRATAEKPSVIGDAAKLREALLRCDAIAQLPEVRNEQSIKDMRNIIRQALAAPPRNCDVGAAEEQAKRFFVFCDSNKCLSCPCRFTRKTDCALIWAQMPYEEGGAK